MTIEEQVLSISEMKELIDLGIDVSNASMGWVHENGDTYVIFGDECDFESGAIPTFTLHDILNILPDDLHDSDGPQRIIMSLQINKGSLGNGIYQIIYSESMHDWDNESNSKFYHSEKDKNPLIAAFEMLKWCKKNKYI